MTSVRLFLRNPGGEGFSIERLFRELAENVPPDIVCESRMCAFVSRGLFRRLYCVAEASWRQGSVNHVTGDVHYLAIGLPGDRTILSVMDCVNLRRLSGWRRRVLKFFWYTWPLARVRVVTTISESTRQELIQLTAVPPDKVRVVHCNVSPVFVPVPTVFNSTTPRILLIGTTPNKNLERVAKALRGLRCEVELIGTPAAHLRAMFDACGVEFRMLGNVPDASVADAYRRCDILLFPSTYEGFGMPIVEAQAVGRPVITSNCSAMPEAAGNGACLVDPFDPASIRAGVERIIDDASYRDELVQRGFVNSQRFSITKIAADYAAIYREVAAEAAKK